MPNTLNVTQEHIDKGVCGSPGYCAVALALKDMFPEYKDDHVGSYVYVGDDLIHIGPYHFYPSNDLKQFIRLFDNWKRVSPYDFGTTALQVQV